MTLSVKENQLPEKNETFRVTMSLEIKDLNGVVHHAVHPEIGIYTDFDKAVKDGEDCIAAAIAKAEKDAGNHDKS